MSIRLKQSTASQEIPLGYFVDSGDGNTEETGLTIANTDIKLWKAGASTLANKNSGGATHISNGIYYCTLDATDTNTLGPLVVFVHVSGALPVRVECEVLAANIYDSLIADTDELQVHANEITAGLITASAIATGAVDADALAADAATEIATSVWASGTRVLTANTNLNDPTAAAIRAEIDSNSTQLAAILADTGTDGVVIATATAQAIADEILKRDAENVEDAASNNSLAELIMAALNSAISGTTWTIKKPSDDSTFNTRTVTTDSGADPITGVT